MFSDDFSAHAPQGDFVTTSEYSDRWGTYGSYPDTSGAGLWTHEAVGTADGELQMRMRTVNGQPQTGTVFPKIPSQTYGRYEVTMRADALPGYYVAFMLWPSSKDYLRDGAVNFPEGQLVQNANAYAHYTGAGSGSDQDVVNSDFNYSDWHRYVIDWRPGKIDFLIDGKVVGSSTTRVPNTPMDWVLQTETAPTVRPDPSTDGYVRVKDVRVYSYKPSGG